MSVMAPVDRVSVGALALADVGAGLYLIGVDAGTAIHALVGVVALVLAFPAAGSAVTGRLLPASDEGVLINAGVLVFMTLEVAFTPGGQVLQVVGVVVLLAAATLAVVGLYYRLFGVLRGTRSGRHVGDER